MQYVIRGATTIEKNCIEDIRSATIELLQEILYRNNFDIIDCESIIFTATKDITKAYPAKYAREIGFNNCALMCLQEMYVEDSLEKCIRVMVTVNIESNDFSPKYVYLNKAVKLRPDIK